MWKMRFQKCEFYENWDFKNVNFVNNDISKMWIMWKMRFQKCDFYENWDLIELHVRPITKRQLGYFLHVKVDHQWNSPVFDTFPVRNNRVILGKFGLVRPVIHQWPTNFHAPKNGPKIGNLKIEIAEMWTLWKLRFQKGEFSKK